MDPKPLDQLLKQELSRKEFLQYVGAAALALAGIASIRQALLDPHGRKTSSSAPVISQPGRRGSSRNNYSTGSYGGN